MSETALLKDVIAIAEEAGLQILAVYHQAAAPQVINKPDNSPLTEADQRAHHHIVAALAGLTPDIPVLSEESEYIDYELRSSWRKYWLVDPLDGTKEFISGNGEFTVNIALIEDGLPVMGVVHAPVMAITYSGIVGHGAEVQKEGISASITARSLIPLPTHLNIVASRHHRGLLVDVLFDKLAAAFADVSVVVMGSSLKICLIAEGKADLYPRLGPTSEWDTAAAHAVLKAAGGTVVNCQGEELRYNQKENLRNPHFIAMADGRFPITKYL